mmetsp:Transcript_43075/g.91613  ORF Transcript_43075/g.91613 Transcript_43075/m.91613 type:complete len:269 (+) Transcript_43075:83-889(+)
MQFDVGPPSLQVPAPPSRKERGHHSVPRPRRRSRDNVGSSEEGGERPPRGARGRTRFETARTRHTEKGHSRQGSSLAKNRTPKTLNLHDLSSLGLLPFVTSIGRRGLPSLALRGPGIGRWRRSTSGTGRRPPRIADVERATLPRPARKIPDLAMQELCLCGNDIGDEGLDCSGEWSAPADLDALLQPNQQHNKQRVTREKILEYHCRNGETDMLDMEGNILPRAVFLICGDVDDRRVGPFASSSKVCPPCSDLSTKRRFPEQNEGDKS